MSRWICFEDATQFGNDVEVEEETPNCPTCFETYAVEKMS